MSDDNSRIECQLRDIRFIAEKVAAAKSECRYGTPAWNALDMAEARLMGLSMYTSFGRKQDAPETNMSSDA